jgi:aspartyl-tRNA(Asn)/glutamyl-tRNA(Gln) amidotransferase subunit A
MKPTFGRISRYGVFPVAWSLDTMGFFTRTVNDAAILLAVLSGHDVNDLTSSDLPVPDYGKAMKAQLPPPRIGVVSQIYGDKADAEVLANTEKVLSTVSKSGAVVEEVSMSADFETLRAAHHLIMATEAASVHESDFSRRPGDYGPKVRMLVEGGMVVPAVAYVQAQRMRRKFRNDIERVIGDFDVLITPSTPSHAPRDLSTTGDGVFQVPWTTAGFPSITIPSGMSGSGLPLGVQLIAAPFSEEKLLSVASWCEEVLAISLGAPV